MNRDNVIEGACLCGAIRYRLSGPLRSPRYCHCANCRKFSGASPAAWAMADSARLEVTSRSAPVGRFDSGRGIRCFCSTCGSPVWFESLEHPEIVGIPLGVLEGGEIPAPEMHLWVASKPAWCDIRDDLPQWQTVPPEPGGPPQQG